MAVHIKSIDKNHLVIDGKYGIDQRSLMNNDVDIVSDHFYQDRSKTYAQRCKDNRQISKGKKPFTVGEFGLAPTNMFKDLLTEGIRDGTAGLLIWRLL